MNRAGMVVFLEKRVLLFHFVRSIEGRLDGPILLLGHAAIRGEGRTFLLDGTGHLSL